MATITKKPKTLLVKPPVNMSGGVQTDIIPPSQTDNTAVTNPDPYLAQQNAQNSMVPKTTVNPVDANTPILADKYTQAKRGGGVSSVGTPWDSGLNNSQPNTTQQPVSNNNPGATGMQSKATDALAGSISNIAEDAKKQQDNLTSQLQYGAIQRDRSQTDLLDNTNITQQRADRQAQDQKMQFDRAIEDTQRASDRNLAILDMTGALSGINRSSGFHTGVENIRSDSLRTIDRLKQDLEMAQTANGEESKALRDNYNKQKARIDQDFSYQYRDFTNRATASLAELTSAGFDPKKMNSAVDKIYEEAQFKTSELFSNYINQQKALNDITNSQIDQSRKTQQFQSDQQKEFINQYIGYSGEQLVGQDVNDLKGYLDAGKISQMDYNLYSGMMKANTIETLKAFGMPTQEDTGVVSALIDKGYTPQEAMAHMIQTYPDRFKVMTKQPDIQTIGNNSTGYYFDQDGKLVVIPGTGGGSPQPQTTTSGPTVDPAQIDNALTSAYNKCLKDPKQCGQFVNDYLQEVGVGRVFNTDTYEGKKDRINSQTPQVGSIAVMASPASPKAGHVAIVTAVNDDGTITVSETNRDNKLAYGERTIPANNVDGYYTPQGSSGPSEAMTPSYQKYMNSGTLPSGMKSGTKAANDFLSGYNQRKSQNNPISDKVQSTIDGYSDDYSRNENVKSAFRFAPIMRTYSNMDVKTLSSSQRQGIISDYAKALDPDSVVREGEYATVARYSQSFGEKTLSELKQFLSGNGTLSDNAAQKVVDAIISRGKNYMEQEKNVRSQYIEKINRKTGNKDGDSELIYPDYGSEQMTTTQSGSGGNKNQEYLISLGITN